MVNRCERFADRDCHVDFVTFGGAQMWPCGFDECPGHACFVVKQHCQSPTMGVRVGRRSNQRCATGGICMRRKKIARQGRAQNWHKAWLPRNQVGCWSLPEGQHRGLMQCGRVELTSPVETSICTRPLDPIHRDLI
ncbi:MAG: hypothetical protein JWQ31_3516 [Mycobacterium sp.]|jgi:hypothetical protein|nr:hypothetical protein [Mycobacterium sp.]